VADREDGDLIVVGAHGHGGFGDRVLGGVSYKLSHRARQPVVIIPPEVEHRSRRNRASGRQPQQDGLQPPDGV
ncbi:MAG TPA: universal stress protein, partial [Acidimicrobiia bacterium]|nr:universal stress protein [Acidimicrobiia bacterium]